MGLINNPNKKKDPLDRGHEIRPKEEFTIDDLQEIKQEQSDTDGKKPLVKSDVDRVTFYSNVRINNHLKNMLEAIAITGNSKSQKESIEKALNYYLDSFSMGERAAINAAIETLEKRDVKQKSKK